MFKIRKRSVREYLTYSSIIVLGILLDQLTKWLAVEFLKPVKSIPLIPEVLHLTYVENRGMAFGMFADNRWIFMLTSTLMITVFLAYLYLGMCENTLYAVSMAMVVSGGIGNMIDRIALGYVVDFIDFTLIDFAVFNGADSFVCVGAGLLILALLLDIIKESKKEDKKDNQSE